MFKYIGNIWCFIHGHDMIEVCFHDNGRSKFWRHECQRKGCDHYSDSQWDYCIQIIF